ncbi:MAG: Maf family protein [Candidatus Margulisbacteria bacterium]|nr:Maf family protein [Candidatus Margulisiibacteriota bacterium]
MQKFKIIAYNTNVAGLKNIAFVFIKPHAAANNAAQEFIEQSLAKKGINILSSDTISGKEIRQKNIIDRHYSEISKKSAVKPADLEISSEVKTKFADIFQANWDKAITQKQMINGFEFMKLLNIDAKQLNELWEKAERHKIGSGLYAIEYLHRGQKLYVLNGFYPAMQAKYTNEDSQVRYYIVSFPQTGWQEFRKLIGSTDPQKADLNSIRGYFQQHQDDYGLMVTNQDNVVHASASALEAMQELMIWQNIQPQEHPLGNALLENGLTQEDLEYFQTNPVISYKGEKTNLWNILEDRNTTDALDIILEAYSYYMTDKIEAEPAVYTKKFLGFTEKLQTEIVGLLFEKFGNQSVAALFKEIALIHVQNPLINEEVLLASKSPRRQYLLEQMGVKFISLESSSSEHKPAVCTNFNNITKTVAAMKLLPFLKNKDLKQQIILTSDTLLYLHDKSVVGKAEGKTKAEQLKAAEKILYSLMGKEHRVCSSVVVFDASKMAMYISSVQTRIIYKKLDSSTDELLKKYISLALDDELKNRGPLGKAGAYGLQEPEILQLMEKVIGDPFTVIGLPVRKTETMLKKCGIKLKEIKPADLYQSIWGIWDKQKYYTLNDRQVNLLDLAFKIIE